MAMVLVMMHIYWLFYMIKCMFAYIEKEEVVNVYDANKTQ